VTGLLRGRGWRRSLSAAWVVALVVLFVASASAQQNVPPGTLVVQLPFSGEADADLLRTAEDAARSALLARGAQGPDRSTVARALAGDAPPTEPERIRAFARTMGATHVLTGSVRPLAGQYNLTLTLYEANGAGSAQNVANMGDGDEGTVVPGMLDGLFAPGAMQAAANAAARAQAERDAAVARQAAEEARVAEEARTSEERELLARDRARREREAREREARMYAFAEGGSLALGGAVEVGGRITAGPTRSMVAPVLAAVRLEGHYAVLPAYGLELGGLVVIDGWPTQAFAAAASARWSAPFRALVPVRGTLGASFGFFQGLTGSRGTAPFVSLELRAEYDAVPTVSFFVGGALDSAVGVFGGLGIVGGVRVRLGAATPASSSAPPPPPATTPTAGSADTGDSSQGTTTER